MLRFLRIPSLMQVIVLAIVWFGFVQPFLTNSFNRVVAYYWWMQPW